MVERPPRRLGPLWVWLVGLVLLLVGIALLVDRIAGREEAVAPAGVTAAGEAPGPAAAQRAAGIEAAERSDVPVPLLTVLPLDTAQVGVLTTFDGDVVGGEVAEGVWLRTDGGVVVFVRILNGGDARPAPGARVAGRGIVRHDPVRVDAWLNEGRLGPAERSTAVSGYHIETTADRLRVR